MIKNFEDVLYRIKDIKDEAMDVVKDAFYLYERVCLLIPDNVAIWLLVFLYSLLFGGILGLLSL